MIAFPLADISFAVGSSFRHRVYLLRFRLAHTITTNTAESQVQFPVTRIFVSHTAGPAIREISRVKRQSVCRSETPGNLHCGRVCTLRLWKCQGRQQRLSCSSSRAILPASDTVVWACDPTPHISPKEHQKERCGHFRPQRSFITFYGALRNILLSAGFPAMFHMITPEQTFVNGPLQKISLADASESNRFYPCFRESRDVVSADIPVR